MPRYPVSFRQWRRRRGTSAAHRIRNVAERSATLPMSSRCKRDLCSENLSLGQGRFDLLQGRHDIVGVTVGHPRKARDGAALGLDLAHQLVQLAREPRGERLREVATREIESIVVAASPHPRRDRAHAQDPARPPSLGRHGICGLLLETGGALEPGARRLHPALSFQSLPFIHERHRVTVGVVAHHCFSTSAIMTRGSAKRTAAASAGSRSGLRDA
jgi:hypothetical protein